MAYITQEQKKEKEMLIKPILKKYGVTARLSIRHHSTLILNISKGKLDFFQDYDTSVTDRLTQPGYLDVNPYWFQYNVHGNSLNFLKEIMEILFQGNHNRSDIQSDYHDVGWYVRVSIGKWDTPYVLTAIPKD